MTKRLTALALVLGLAAVACGGQELASVDPLAGVERYFVPQSVDHLGDVGRGHAIAVDAEGNPHLSYLTVEEELEEGEVAEPRPIGAPMPPAVLHAHLTGGVWTRSTLLQEAADVTRESATGIAVDEGGVHHVVWTESGTRLAYSNNQTGQFSEPEAIIAGTVSGISIAVGPSGAPWVTFYQGGRIRAATGGPGAWRVEDVAPVGQGPTDLPARTAVRVGPDGQPVVAFAEPVQGIPMVATRDSGGNWSVEEVEAGGGGFAISLALDADGNPHVAYYTAPANGGGEVRHAHAVGGPWEVSRVGTYTIGEKDQPADFSAGIALDQEGVHYITWNAGPGGARPVRFATNKSGTFEEEPVYGAESATAPVIATTADGSKVYVAWFDANNLDMEMGTFGAPQELVLAQPGETAGPPPTTPPPTGPAQECPEDGIEIAAPPGASVNGFDQTSLQGPAGEPFVICFDNQDGVVTHNIHVFDGPDPTAPTVASTDIAPAPILQILDVPAVDASDYFYQCDVHPATMTGTLTVK